MSARAAAPYSGGRVRPILPRGTAPATHAPIAGASAVNDIETGPAVGEPGGGQVIRRALSFSGTAQAEDECVLFFARSPDLLCSAGFDGYFKRLNPAWTAVLGWALDELTASPFLSFVHPDDRQATQAEVDALVNGADTILFENRYRHRDGSYRWLQWNAWPAGQALIHAAARDVTRLKQLEREVLEVADRERENIGRELHDGLCQTLAGIAALSSTLSRRLAGGAETAAAAAAAEITTLLKAAISETHDMAHGLSTMYVQAIPLDAALATLTSSVQHLFGVSCALECEEPFLRPGPEAEHHLFRIAQEAVNNSVAHGRAARIDIRLSSHDGTGLLSVQDDGVGLPEQAHDYQGIGLHTMAYRARLIGGALTVRRGRPTGTVVDCAFPLMATSTSRGNPDRGRV